MTGSTYIHSWTIIFFCHFVFKQKLSWGSKKLRACFQFAFKKKLTSCTLRERHKIIHQTKLDSSTQNPKQRENVLQKTKSCTRLNWTTALKIPEQRGNALQITNLNIEVPSEHQNHICLLHIWSIPKNWLLTQNHTGSWYTTVLYHLLAACFKSFMFLAVPVQNPEIFFVFLYYRAICKIVLAQWSHCISTPLVKSLNGYNTGLPNGKIRCNDGFDKCESLFHQFKLLPILWLNPKMLLNKSPERTCLWVSPNIFSAIG